MKTLLCILLSLIFKAGVILAQSEVTPTKNKFSTELKADLLSRVSFSKSENTIHMQALADATLPLEFIDGKGLEASDGSLVEGGSFAWPGCGFDRTSYQIRRVTAEYIEIGYSRGIPQQDGYHDSGVFRVDYSKQ